MRDVHEDVRRERIYGGAQRTRIVQYVESDVEIGPEVPVGLYRHYLLNMIIRRRIASRRGWHISGRRGSKSFRQWHIGQSNVWALPCWECGMD